MSSGLTILELLIALAVTAILMALAIPSIAHLIKQNEIISMQNQIVTAIRLTRSAAIQRHQVVQYCGSSDGKACDGKWDIGQIVKVSSKPEVLRHFSRLLPGYHLNWRSSFGINHQLAFIATGFTQGQQGRFTLSKAEQPTFEVIVSRSGRIRISHIKQ